MLERRWKRKQRAGVVGKPEISAAENGEKRKGGEQVERWWRRWPPGGAREKEREITHPIHTHWVGSSRWPEGSSDDKFTAGHPRVPVRALVFSVPGACVWARAHRIVCARERARARDSVPSVGRPRVCLSVLVDLVEKRGLPLLLCLPVFRAAHQSSCLSE